MSYLYYDKDKYSHFYNEEYINFKSKTSIYQPFSPSFSGTQIFLQKNWQEMQAWSMKNPALRPHLY